MKSVGSSSSWLADWARTARTLPQHALVSRMLTRLREVNTMEAAARLAAQTFLAALPLLIVVAAFAPHGVKDQLADSCRALGGGSTSADELKQAFAARGDVRDTAGALGVVIALISATALSRAVQRICERCWELPGGRARLTAWRWLVWLLVWLVVLLLQARVRDGFGVGTDLGVPLVMLTSVLMWWWTQHLLLGARIGWAPLLPGALLTGLGMVAFTYGSRLVTPRALQRSLAQFGPLGYVFTLLSWLIAASCVIVVGIALGQVIATSGPFPRWLGTQVSAPPEE